MLDRVVSRSECSEQLDIVNSFMCLFLKSQVEEKINREGEEKKKAHGFAIHRDCRLSVARRQRTSEKVSEIFTEAISEKGSGGEGSKQ